MIVKIDFMESIMGFIIGVICLFFVSEVMKWLFEYFSSDQMEKRFILLNYRKTFIVMICITVCLYYLLIVVSWKDRPGFFYDDEPLYDVLGKMVAERWYSSTWFRIPIRFGVIIDSNAQPGMFYPWIIGGIYYIFGYYPLLVRLLNVLFGLLTAVSTSSISRMLFPDNKKLPIYVFWSVALAPHILIWSTNETRDIHVVACTSILIWSIIILLRKYRIEILLVIFPAFLYLYYIRPISAFFLIIFIVPSLFMRTLGILPRDQINSFFGKFVSGIILFVFISVMPFAVQEVSNKLLQYGSDINVGSSSLFSYSGMDFRSFLHPSPFWVFKEFSFALQFQFLPGMTWYILMPFSLYGLFAAFKTLNPEILGICIFTIFMVILSIFSTATNYNDPMRARTPVLPYLILFACWIYTRLDMDINVRKNMQVIGTFFYAMLLLSGGYDLLNDFLSLRMIFLVLILLPGALFLIGWTWRKLFVFEV